MPWTDVEKRRAYDRVRRRLANRIASNDRYNKSAKGRAVGLAKTIRHRGTIKGMFTTAQTRLNRRIKEHSIRLKELLQCVEESNKS